MLDILYYLSAVLYYGFYFVASMVLALVVMGVEWSSWDARRTLNTLAASPCPHCGAALGLRAVKGGQAACRKAFAKLRRENPGIKFRMHWEWGIECPKCGMISYYDVDGQSLNTEPFRRRLEIEGGRRGVDRVHRA